MADKVNFQGKIRLTQGIDTVMFEKVNVAIVASKISKDYENLLGSKISVLKGYSYSAKIDIIMLNSLTYLTDRMNWLLGMLSYISRVNPIIISFYKEDGATISAEISFEDIVGDVKYTDYLSENAKLGIKFSIELQTLSIVSKTNLLDRW